MAVEKYVLTRASDPAEAPRRVAFIQRNVSAAVRRPSERMVMTFPHLIAREIVAFQVLVILLSLVSLLWDAPLEGIANPNKTPNPAKAPWYFLGLQELLHYFPPVVAGVLLPVLAVVALIVIPYFGVNVRRDVLWKEHERKSLFGFIAGVVLLLGVLVVFQVWLLVAPSLVMAATMVVTYFYPRSEGVWGWVCSRSLAVWIMTWFVVSAAALTLTGLLFRGPGWSFVWP